MEIMWTIGENPISVPRKTHDNQPGDSSIDTTVERAIPSRNFRV
jgi:hypothetical protein